MIADLLGPLRSGALSAADAVAAQLDPAGLPVAVQLVGRPWEDHVVLAAARTISP